MEAVSLHRVYDYEVSRNDLVSPEQSLRVSLARSGKRNLAKSIFFAWPNIEVASRKLAALLTHHYPNRNGKGYLLDEALVAACDIYETSVESTAFTLRMAMYLKTLLQTTSDGLLYWDTHGILSNGETLAWMVGAVPLQDWVRRKNADRIVFTARQELPGVEDKEAARISLASSIMSFNDLLHVTRLERKERG